MCCLWLNFYIALYFSDNGSFASFNFASSVWYEMRVFWPNINHVKSHDLALAFSVETVWIRSFKWGTVCSCRSGGCKNIRGKSWRSIKIADSPRLETDVPGAQLIWKISFDLQLWHSDIFAASWSIRMFSTSFERSDSYLSGDSKLRSWHKF